MHPNAFLKTFWRLEVKKQIFVAMSFDPQYQPRYDQVIAPVIEAIIVNNVPLKAYRVDISKSGDSILTDIMEGIAHSQLVLADVSIVGRDSVSSIPYRNGNVLYEVGVALACRQPEDVLLVRDDKEKFLFDVSTIPHMHLDFTNIEVARQKLQSELMDRLRQQAYINDARIRMAVASLSVQEVEELKQMARRPPNTVWGPKATGSVDFMRMVSIPRLLDKGLICVAGEFEEGNPAYLPTPLGLVVAKIVESGLQKFQSDTETEDKIKLDNEQEKNLEKPQ